MQEVQQIRIMPDPLLSLLIAIALGAGVFYALRHFPRWRQRWEMSERVLSEDALKHIHKFEMKGQPSTIESVAGIVNLNLDSTAELLAAMEKDRLLLIDGGTIQLTAKGRVTALHVIRVHRLWERYLAEETGYGEADWHGQAERREHQLSPAEADSLAARLGNPTHDPHGDPIPTAAGEMVDHGGESLCSLPNDTKVRIVHLEDEPEVVYAQLVAEGLYPGMIVRVIESTPERVRIWAGGNEHFLAPIVAMNVTVETLPAEILEEIVEAQTSLSSLRLGESGEVVSIARKCRGAERRRFMDLGILPGTRVTAEMRSPSNDPTAYRVRGALIALRFEQAALIYIKGVAS